MYLVLNPGCVHPLGSAGPGLTDRLDSCGTEPVPASRLCLDGLTKNKAQLFGLFALGKLVLARRLLPSHGGYCALRTPKGPGKPGQKPETRSV